MSERMPALFIGHGNPMNALLVNPYTQRWAAIGAALPKPRAILSVSAHWYIEDAAVTVNTAPRTIHDFGGFPRELYQVQYPAPGDSGLAARVQSRVAQHGVEKQPLVAVCGRFAKCSIVAGTAWRPWKGPRSVPRDVEPAASHMYVVANGIPSAAVSVTLQ
jgi:Catalytic LigB subunit of aromatic ring-opening dioxygenase